MFRNSCRRGDTLSPSKTTMTEVNTFSDLRKGWSEIPESKLSRTKLTTGIHTLLLNLAKYDAKIKDRIHLAKVGQIPQKMLGSTYRTSNFNWFPKH